MNLLDKRLIGTIVMRDEPSFDEVQFPELMEKIPRSVKASLKEICGKRGKYEHTEEFHAKRKSKAAAGGHS